jgi:hypothetical protein
MADQKLSELATAEAGLNDLTYIVKNGVSKKATVSSLARTVAGTIVVSAPAYTTSSGTAGTIAYDTSSIYVCVSTNTWRRAALTTW